MDLRDANPGLTAQIRAAIIDQLERDAVCCSVGVDELTDRLLAVLDESGYDLPLEISHGEGLGPRISAAEGRERLEAYAREGPVSDKELIQCKVANPYRHTLPQVEAMAKRWNLTLPLALARLNTLIEKAQFA